MRTYPRGSARRGFIGLSLLILGALALVALALAVNALTLNREAGALRRAVVSVDGVQAKLLAQGSVGPVLCAAVRQGLAWWPEVPEEAREALGVVRGASFAVHRLETAPDADRREAMAAAATVAMTQRGWQTTVAVRDGDDTVLVFTRRDGSSGQRLRVSVAVCSGRDLVVAEGRLSTPGITALVQRHWPDLQKL